MNKLLFLLTIISIVSCVDKKNTPEYQKALTKLKVYEDLESTENNTRQLMVNYIKDVNAPDWKTEVPKYFDPSPEMDAFMEEHTEFRKSFPNYKSTIKHMTIDGKKGIVWMNITANYVVTYTYDNSVEVVKGIEAKNQTLSWDEAWTFSLDSDGKFSDEWYYLKDNHKILEDLEVNKKP